MCAAFGLNYLTLLVKYHLSSHSFGLNTNLTHLPPKVLYPEMACTVSASRTSYSSYLTKLDSVSVHSFRVSDVLQTGKRVCLYATLCTLLETLPMIHYSLFKRTEKSYLCCLR